MANTLIIWLINILLIHANLSHCVSSPIREFANYEHSTELQQNVADLWWTIDEVKKEITFELHVRTTGWIALGISPGYKKTPSKID